MTRLRTKIVILAVMLPLWEALAGAPASLWPLVLGTVLGLLAALVLTLPLPWDHD